MNQLTLAEVADLELVATRLHDAGFSAATCHTLSQRFAEVARRLKIEGVDGSLAVQAWFVPGRIEVFGKHTDYAGGRSVVAAAERGFCGVAVARDDSAVRVVDVVKDLETQFALLQDAPQQTGNWSNYPMTVARRITANFSSVRRGATIGLASDLPPAAGMSSSSALMVLTFLLLGQINSVTDDPAFRANIRTREDLAGYLGTVENGQTFGHLVGDRGVGTFGGSEDHTAILLAKPSAWVQYAYCPVRFERSITAPPDYQFVIGVSGVVAEKTGAARELYNRAARRVSVVSRLLQAELELPGANVAELVEKSGEDCRSLCQRLELVEHPEFTGIELCDRLEQFVVENSEIIPAIPDQLTMPSLGRLGELARRSQRLGAEKLGNQIPETVFLAESASQLGAAAASAQGAGFGGSVWALVAEEQVPSFLERWSAAYCQAFPEHAGTADFFTTAAGPPATVLSGRAISLPSV
jgi:galactokinase